MAVTFRFTLRFEDQTLTFGTKNVKNWSDIKPSIKRSDTLRGAIRQFTNTFEFVGDARYFILKAEEKAGIDCELYLKIEIGNESGWLSSFEQIGDELIADFATTYINGESVLNVAFALSGFQQAVINRWDTVVSHNQLIAIDGQVISGDSDTTDKLLLHVRDLDQTTKYNAGEVFTQYYDGSSMTLPTKAEYFGDDHSFDQVQIGFNRVVNEPLDHSFAFIQNVAFETILSVTYDINVSFSRDGGIGIGRIEFVLTEGDSLGNNSEWITLASKDNNNLETCEMSASGTQELTIPVGWNCFLVIRAFREGTSVNPVIKLNSCDLSMVSFTKIIDYPTSVDSIFIHEAIERNLQLITGVQQPLYAPVFGRDTIGYAYNGDHSFTFVANGYMLRNFPYQNKPLITSLKKLLGSAINCYNLICSFKVIDNQLKFVIEPYLEAFRLDYQESELVTFEEIDIVDLELNEKMHYSSISVGYENQEYKEVNGVLPYNSKFDFACPLKSVDNSLDIISQIRADDYGIEYKRRKQYVNYPTTDTSGDSDVWFIRGVVGGAPYICERNESFSDVQGIWSPSTAYNLNISPSRNLKRWLPVIATGISKKKTQSIKYLAAEKNSSLATQKLNEPLLVEAADIPISTIAEPILLPYIITLTAKCTVAQWNDILVNPNKPIKIFTKSMGKTIPLYGIVDSAEFNINAGKIENLRLIRVNR